MADTYSRVTAEAQAAALKEHARLSNLQASETRSVELELVHDGEQQEQKDYWITRDGLTFAGVHLIVDMWEASGLDNEQLVQDALTRAASEANATLLHIHTHKFEEGGGISGVAVLAESHISVHTWPERSFAAFDVFMCGDARPVDAIKALKEAFNPGRINVVEHKRGIAL